MLYNAIHNCFNFTVRYEIDCEDATTLHHVSDALKYSAAFAGVIL